MKRQLIVWACATAGVVACVSLTTFLERHDREVAAAATRYAACVAQEYGITPSAFYAEQGYYPTCNN